MEKHTLSLDLPHRYACLILHFNYQKKIASKLRNFSDY